MRRGPVIDAYADRMNAFKEKLRHRAKQVTELRAKVYELDEACKRKDALLQTLAGNVEHYAQGPEPFAAKAREEAGKR